VDRIGKSITGEVQLDLTHFPVDAARASLVAQEVNDATGSGLLLPTGLSGITCDINSFSDTNVPAETFTDGTFPDYGSEISDRDYSCDGVAAIQFSFEVYNGVNAVTWYNARLVDSIWRYYFPVGSNTEVFQGANPGQVRSVRNTGCGGDGSGGQLDGNSLDGFADAGGFGGGGGGGDPTGDNPEDVLDGQADVVDPFANYPKPSDANYPPSPPAGLEPVLMGNGNLAPGPAPTEWTPGTWTTNISYTLTTVTISGQSTIDGPCNFITNATAVGAGSENIAGPCWGLYRVVSSGSCGVITVAWYTAVIGSGYSYWHTIATFAGGGLAAGKYTGSTDPGTPISLTNTFTPL